MIIYCCGCEKDITARLTDGKEVYPHRRDLYRLPFWVCAVCGNYVGCHHKTKNRTKPLGVIPTKEIREGRLKVHGIIDPLWKSKSIARRDLYLLISKNLGYSYHTADLKSIGEVKRVLFIVSKISEELRQGV